MKKGVKLSAATVLAISALTPVAVFAAEEQSVADGFYVDGEFLPLSEFQQLSKKDKKQFLINNIANNAIVLVQNGKVFDLTNAEIQNAPAESVVDLGVDVSVYEQETGNKLDPSKGLVSDDVEAELKVESVSAINPTTIKVVFNEDVTEEALATSNFSLSKGNIEAVTATGNVATISVAGLTYGDAVTVTVGNPAYTKEVTVPEVSELFLLEITTDAENDTILSDGAANTQVTVTLKDRQTGEIVDQDGVVQFQVTNGALGQTTSALVDGKATVQLTSEASATSITSILTATISDAPGAGEFKGLTAQKAIIFSPNPAEEEVVQFVSPVYAEAKAGDRFFVQFSDKISAAAYKEIAIEEGYGIRIDGKLADIIDVKQSTDNALEFILDTDEDGSIQRIEKTTAWTSSNADANYLRDNVTHTIEFVGNDLVLGNVGSGIDFILTDTSRPAVLGVTAKDQLEFTVRFTEAVDRRTATDLANYLIDGREILAVTNNPTAQEIAQAKAQNKVILTELNVGTYYKTINGVKTAVDERNIVTFKLHKDFALEEGVHQIQVANVGDYAQDVDPAQNIVVTDTFDFNVKADNSIPVPEVVVQSPEQWLVKFDKPVYAVSGSKTIADVFSINSADEDDTFTMGDAPGAGVDYIVSAIDEDGETGRILDPARPASDLDGEQYFLIEFTQDWTVKYGTEANPTETYFASTKNPYTITIENLESAIGNKIDKKELNVNLSYDGLSPKIASATQEKDNDGNYKDSVRVVMTEPVKLNLAHPVNHEEGLTPSEQQAAQDGVPVPTFEFVKGDKVVKAKASEFSYDNYAFTLTPDGDLDAGEWTLYIRSISDDIGNTSATESTKVTIVVPEQEETDTRIAWAAFDDANGDNKLLHGVTHKDKDVIYVKFTKVMKADGANGVSRTQNYVFQGQPLPTGSQVLKGIAGVTNDWDGVTIVMPKGTWNGIEPGSTTSPGDDFGVALNVASNFQAADGEKLSGAYEVELTDTNTTTDTLDDGFEALYRDAGPIDTRNQVTFGGQAAVKGAIVQDDGIVDGKINSIKLTAEGTIPEDAEVLVNGKTFVVKTGNVIEAKTANDRIDGTTTDKLKITGKNGSIIINTNSVVDDAAPVITKAELNAGKDKITLTFSEAVTKNNDGTFKALEDTDFTVTGGGSATVSDVEHSDATPNKVVLTITGGAGLTTDDTVDVTAYDFAGNAFLTAFGPITGATDADVAAAQEKLDGDGPATITQDDLDALGITDGEITITGSGEKTIAVNLNKVTVNNPDADVVIAEGVTVGELVIDNAAGDTVTINGTVGTVTINDTDGVRLVIGVTGKVTTVNIDATVNLATVTVVVNSEDTIVVTQGETTINVDKNSEGTLEDLVEDETPSAPANNAPTVKDGQGTQTGSATPESSTDSATTPAVAYNADVSEWFEDADGDALTYSVVSAKDEEENDVSGDVSIDENGNLKYIPAVGQASKTVTIVVKASDGTADSETVTITVTVNAQPE